MSKADWREGLSGEERDRAIESILDDALPACEAPRARMRGNFAALSLRALFFGIEDCAILAGIITLAGAAPLATRGCLPIWRKSLRSPSGQGFAWTMGFWMRWRRVQQAAFATSSHGPCPTPRAYSLVLVRTNMVLLRWAIWMRR